MNQIRFSHLEIGMLFNYQNVSYRKSTPLLAISADNHQRMIPRSAMVEVVGTDKSPSKIHVANAHQPVNPQEIVEALDDFTRECHQLIQSLSTPLNLKQINQARKQLQVFSATLFDRLNIEINHEN